MQPMEATAEPEPAYLGRPLRLHAFRGQTLPARRVGGGASARALARPYREQAAELAADPAPAIYLHEYTVAGLTVRGIVGALDLTSRASRPEDSPVLPHEGVESGQVTRLAERMLELGLQPAPILLVHRGPEVVRDALRSVPERPADRAFSDRAGQHHRVWAMRDPELLDTVAAALAEATVVIADGHHRYAAYLRLQQERPGPPWDRGLAMVVDQDDTPLHLGPIHRVLPGTRLGELTALAERLGWSVRPLPPRRALDALAPATVVLTDGADWIALDLTPADGEAVVEVVHARLLNGLERAHRLGYHHGVETAIREVRRRPGVAVLLPAPAFDQVAAVARRELLFPEKATSFQPKPSIGVLMRSLRDE